jgi:hypothetical protein
MMMVPTQSISKLRRGKPFAAPFGLAALLLLLCTPLFARNPQPVTRIPLESLDYQAPLVRYLLAGSSMLTLHYVDDSHLLLTFSARRLLKRIPGDPPDDQDHVVNAVLLELPSGRVLARTEWRLHDYGQYLWSLSHGQFLLRIRSTLTLIAPLVNLDRGNAFAERPFLHTGRQFVAVRISPTSDLLTLQTIDPPPVTHDSLGSANSPADANPPPEPSEVQINFFRLAPPAPGRDYFIPLSAGIARSNRPVDLPINAAGALHVVDEGKQRWGFDFKSYNGKVLELAPFDSTCRPYPALVSASEFVSFGCHGGTVRQRLAGFNFRGDEMWEQDIYGSYISPSMDFALAVGRFALGRLIVSSAAIESNSLTSSEVSAQTVDVYQIDSGKPLLHVECTPASRAGQNFTFSPDGLNLAIVHDDAIEIYRLPPLSAKDQAAVKLAAASVPEPNQVPVDLTDSAANAQQEKIASEANHTSQTPQSGSAPVPSVQQPQPPPVTAGDPPPEQPRKPPSLYSPDESKPQ